MIEEQKWSWAAGIYEGEGCCYLKDGYPCLEINMTDQDVVEKFVDIVGYGKANYIHVPSQAKRGDQPLYRWRAYKKAERERIAISMAPYLGVRRLAKLLELDIIKEVPEKPISNLAWATGVFEAEGCISGWSNRSMRRLSLAMTDRDVVERFASVVGHGNTRQSNAPAFKNSNRQSPYVWDIAKKEEVIRICEEMLPWLGERRRAKIEELGILTFSY